MKTRGTILKGRSGSKASKPFRISRTLLLVLQPQKEEGALQKITSKTNLKRSAALVKRRLCSTMTGLLRTTRSCWSSKKWYSKCLLRITAVLWARGPGNRRRLIRRIRRAPQKRTKHLLAPTNLPASRSRLSWSWSRLQASTLWSSSTSTSTTNQKCRRNCLLLFKTGQG